MNTVHKGGVSRHHRTFLAWARTHDPGDVAGDAYTLLLETPVVEASGRCAYCGCRTASTACDGCDDLLLLDPYGATL